MKHGSGPARPSRQARRRPPVSSSVTSSTGSISHEA
jgi:hypothetical protein